MLRLLYSLLICTAAAAACFETEGMTHLLRSYPQQPFTGCRMGVRLHSVMSNAKQIHKLQSLLTKNRSNVPKGHIPVYVGEVHKKRFVIPTSNLNHPLFLDFLNRAEEEFGFDHPMGSPTIPCNQDAFIDLTSQLNPL
ncbi:Small auxin-up RNA [Dillenia turbinata]|uniref:Small auxin-up RNA n=1 Tax=Dillenia turbinata TaxID=194707 RepID=A0AAN8YXD6_9MAGN